MTAQPAPRSDVQSRITSYWDRWAAEYDANQSALLAQDGHRELWTRVYAEALPESTLEVLDVGTGSGNVALLLADLGCTVTGIDLSEGMLEQARAKVAEREAAGAGVAGAVRFVPGDAVAPPLPAGSVDAIVSRYVLWTLRDAPQALDRWFDLLRPGGAVVAVDSPWFAGGEELPGATDRQVHFARAYDEGAFNRLTFGRADAAAIAEQLRAAGFEQVRADPLQEVYEMDLADGVAPGHTAQMQYRFSARRPA